MSVKCHMKWNDFQSHIGSFLANLYTSEDFFDVTLIAEETQFHCHRVILSACSPYFKNILSQVSSKHPIILITDITPLDLKSILRFIYNGEVNFDSERFPYVIRAAQILKICGLTQVKEQTISSTIDATAETFDPGSLKQETLMNDGTVLYVEEVSTENVENEVELNECSSDNGNVRDIYYPKWKTKKHSISKKYSDNNLHKALNSIAEGMSLNEAARLYGIPKSTLFDRTKASRRPPRKFRSYQDCEAAVQAVGDGMSLKRAADMYHIPKTVLWRRVNKRFEVNLSLREKHKTKNKQSTSSVDGTERSSKQNDRIAEVATEYQALKNSRPHSSEEGGDNTLEGSREARLSLAIAACREGRMSQYTASSVFQIPKTTIWRAIKKCSSNVSDSETDGCEMKADEHDYCLEQNSDNYTEPSTSISIENPHFVTSPIIILNSTGAEIDNSTRANSEGMDEVNQIIEVVSYNQEEKDV